MTITVELPDALERLLFVDGEEPTRAVLEAIALEGYRADRLSESDVGQLLSFETRAEVHQFLGKHGALTVAERRRLEGRKSLVELFAESPLKGLDLDFSRNRSTGRPVDL